MMNMITAIRLLLPITRRQYVNEKYVCFDHDSDSF